MTDNTTSDIKIILKTIGSAERIAVVLPQQVNLDLLAAAVALATAIASPGGGSPKTAMIFSVAKAMPRLPFLKAMPPVYSALSTGPQLAIKVSNQNAQPSELRYEKSDDGLTVYITPSTGQFAEGDVSVLPSAGKFDLVIILGAANLEQLGRIYTDNTKLFFETPNINIDTNPANEFYGTMNFVHTTASGVSEVVMDIIEAMTGVDGSVQANAPQMSALANDTVSTALLAGIISQTASFRDPRTTPNSLLKASRLVSAGARQQDIIQHLFKTKPLSLLQLWGRALARLTALPEKQTLTAVLTKSDLEKTQVGIESLPIIVKDIIEMITGYSLVVLLAELSVGGVEVVAAGLPFEDLAKFVAEFAGSADQKPAGAKPTMLTGRYQYLTVRLSSSLAEVQDQLNKIIFNRSSVL